MTNNSNFYDYKVFIKNNLKVILTTTFTLLFIVFLAFFSYINKPVINGTIAENNEEYVVNQLLPNIKSVDDLDALSEEDRTLLSEYIDKDSYLFRIYIEKEDESPFSENQVLEEVLTSESIVQALQEETSTDLSQFSLLNFAVSRLPGSHMLQIQVATNDKNTNQYIANFYYQYIREADIPLLNDKEIYFIDSKVTPYEELYGTEETTGVDVVNQELNMIEKIYGNIEGLIIVTVLGILSGLLGGLFIALIKERINKKIPSIYNFLDFKNVDTINLDSIEPTTMEESDKIIAQSIIAENINNKLILSEKKINKRIYEKINTKISNSEMKYYFINRSLEDVDLRDATEIIILVEIYETSKEWFERQMEQVRYLKIPIKVIRIPILFNNFEEI